MKILKSNHGFSWLGLVIIVLIIAVIITIAIFLGKGLGRGKGNGDGEGDGNTKVNTNQEEASQEENDTIVDEEITREENNSAIDSFAGAIIKVTVYGNEYLHDSERITLNDLLVLIDSTESDIVVEIYDDNASLKAYNSLIEKLKEHRIKYVEE